MTSEDRTGHARRFTVEVYDVTHVDKLPLYLGTIQVDQPPLEGQPLFASGFRPPSGQSVLVPQHVMPQPSDRTAAGTEEATFFVVHAKWVQP